MAKWKVQVSGDKQVTSWQSGTKTYTVTASTEASAMRIAKNKAMDAGLCRTYVDTVKCVEPDYTPCCQPYRPATRAYTPVCAPAPACANYQPLHCY